jgi:hypothetical protein
MVCPGMISGQTPKGLISFDDDGAVLASPTLSVAAQRSLAIDTVPRLEGLRDEHRANLAKHRSRHGFLGEGGRIHGKSTSLQP